MPVGHLYVFFGKMSIYAFYFILFYFRLFNNFLKKYLLEYIVGLKCCVSFCCTAKWISYTYTYIHSFLDSFPVYVITEYWVEFPVLHSRSLLIIYFIYSSVYMSTPISHFIPPCYVSPLVTISLFSKSVSYNNFKWSIIYKNIESLCFTP